MPSILKEPMEEIRWEKGSTVIRRFGPDTVRIYDDHGTLLVEYSGDCGRDFKKLWFFKGVGDNDPEEFKSLEPLLAYYGIVSATVENHKALIRRLVGLARLTNHMALDHQKEGHMREADFCFGEAHAYIGAARSCRKELLHTHNPDVD